MGAGAARNTGTRHARATWVAFQDSDDEWLPAKLEKQMERLATAGPDRVAVYCGMAVVGEVDKDWPEPDAIALYSRSRDQACRRRHPPHASAQEPSQHPNLDRPS